MDNSKNSTRSSKKKAQTKEKAYDINSEKEQQEDTSSSTAPDQPLSEMNE